MGSIYVARSASLCNWGSDVGLGKHLFKLGYAEDSAEAAVKELAAAGYAGATDWALIRKEEAADADEAQLVGRLARKEKMLEAALYPRLRGAVGIFKVKLTNVENHLLLKQAYGNESLKVAKLRNPDIAVYLIANALG